MYSVIDKKTLVKLYDTASPPTALAENEELVAFIPDVMSDDIILKNEQDKEFELYLKRKSDGETAYLKLSAEFRIAKLNGLISEESHSHIEECLTPVRNEIMFGQWKKGLEILESIDSDTIGDELYGRLLIQLKEYISKNY